jgi:two-component system, LytTR family, response regulator
MVYKKIRSVIVEDELYDRLLIEKILQTNYSNYVEISDAVGTTEEAIISIKKNNPDLLFLDIELAGNRNGAFSILEQVNHRFKIIFVTAKSDQDDLLKAIKLSCIDYLVKPTKISDFEMPIKKVYEELNSFRENSCNRIEIFKHNMLVRNIQDAKISLQDGFTYLPVQLKEIIRCEAQGNYSLFYFTGSSSRLINGNLKSFEDQLSDVGFCRISKSDFINLMHVKAVSRKNLSWEILMSDNKTVYISTQRRQNFQLQYDSIHLNKYLKF